MVFVKASVILSLLATATALPKLSSPPNFDPRAVPLTKRNDLISVKKRNLGSFPGTATFNAEIAKTKRYIMASFPSYQYDLHLLTSKLQAGLSAIHRNTGKVHPASQGFQGSFTPAHDVKPLPALAPGKQKRDDGAADLTDVSNNLWYGSLSVGTPPQMFTGSFV
jgi:hypothetical protein